MTAQKAHPPGAPEGGWTTLIDDIREGRWISPLTGTAAPAAPFETIRIEDDLDGAEAELVAALGFDRDTVVVADENTWEAMGRRVTRNLGDLPNVVIAGDAHADEPMVATLSEKLRGFTHVVAVGGGTVNDLCKYVTAADGRRYCVFGTAASMDGYTSTTASITRASGLKTSLPAQAAAGVYLDLSVAAAAPARLSAAGFGDTICRSVCQTDWWLSHRLLGTDYHATPYVMAAGDEAIVMDTAPALAALSRDAVGYLQRALVLSGLGVAFTGTSAHGSQSEHQVSHYIDCFAGDRHPGTLHGEQVGVATLTMARLHESILAEEDPPVLQPTRVDAADMARRMGREIGAQCAEACREKAHGVEETARLNDRLAEIWPDRRRESAAFAVPTDRIAALLRAAGAPVTSDDLGVAKPLWREAVRHGHEMRNRYSFADLACDAGLLDRFAETA